MCLKLLIFAALLLVSEARLQAQSLSDPILPGEIPLFATQEGGIRENSFSLGLRTSVDFDDDALGTARSKQSDLLTIVEPHVGWNVSRPAAKWAIDYRPGFSNSRVLGTYNLPSEFLNGSLELAVTKRLRLRAHETFLRTNNAFDQLQTSQHISTSGAANLLNSNIITTARMNNEQAGMDLAYSLGPRSMVGLNGTFYNVSYTSSSDARELGAARAASANTFYSYRLTRHNSIGVDWNVQELVSRDPHSRSLVERVLYTQAMLLTASNKLTFFLGPEHSAFRTDSGSSLSETISALSRQKEWSWTGGANYVCSRKSTTLLLGWNRRISDGAALEGIVRLSSTSAEVRQVLTRRWKINALASEDHAQGLAVRTEPLSYVSVAFGATRAITPRLSLDVRYWHAHATTSNPVAANLANHNRLSASLIYNFTAPVSRQHR